MTVEAGGLKPGGVGVYANSGLNEVEELVPYIQSFRLSTHLRSGCHCHGKKANNQRSDYFHRCEKTVESEFALKLHALEFLPVPERMS
jgi:hypothetical protein